MYDWEYEEAAEERDNKLRREQRGFDDAESTPTDELLREEAERQEKERQEGFEGSTGALLQFCSEDQRKETLAERLQNRS